MTGEGLLETVIPATAFVAIALFIVKELLEFVRRIRANQRKLAAIKRMIAREIELNAWAIRGMRQALSHIESYVNGTDERKPNIIREPSGRYKFEMRFANGNDGYSCPLESIRDEVQHKHLLDVASLDKKLFEHLEAAIGATAEIAHVRSSLFDLIDDEMWLEPFVEYAQKEFSRQEAQLTILYKACTGSSEIKQRIR